MSSKDVFGLEMWRTGGLEGCDDGRGARQVRRYKLSTTCLRCPEGGGGLTYIGDGSLCQIIDQGPYSKDGLQRQCRDYVASADGRGAELWTCVDGKLDGSSSHNDDDAKTAGMCGYGREYCSALTGEQMGRLKLKRGVSCAQVRINSAY